MNKFLLYILISATLIITNCNDVSVVNPELNYKEYVVVRSKFMPYQNIEGVNISRTLPIDEPYDTNKAFIKDAIAYLKIDGVKIVPLHYFQNGYYKPYGMLSPAPGETYELFASANNTTFYAVTKIPNPPQVTNVFYSNGHLSASVKSNPNEVYGALWAIVNPFNSSVIDAGNDFLSIVGTTNNTINNYTDVNTKDIPNKYNADTYKDYRCIKVYAFDIPYLNYFNTKNNNQPVSNAFVQGGDQIIWNVLGKNVIGLFIGVAEGNYVRSN
jgi:hypothetical protein